MFLSIIILFSSCSFKRGLIFWNFVFVLSSIHCFSNASVRRRHTLEIMLALMVIIKIFRIIHKLSVTRVVTRLIGRVDVR